MSLVDIHNYIIIDSEISGRLLPTKNNKTLWIHNGTFLKKLYIFWTWVPETALKSLIRQNSSSTTKQVNVHHACQGCQRENKFLLFSWYFEKGIIVNRNHAREGTTTVKIYMLIYLYRFLISWISSKSRLLCNR